MRIYEAVGRLTDLPDGQLPTTGQYQAVRTLVRFMNLANTNLNISKRTVLSLIQEYEEVHGDE